MQAVQQHFGPQEEDKEGLKESLLPKNLSAADEQAEELGLRTIYGYEIVLWKNVLFWLFFGSFAIVLCVGVYFWVTALYVDTASIVFAWMGLSSVFVGLQFLVLFRWLPGLYVHLRSYPAPLVTADIVVVSTADGEYSAVQVQEGTRNSFDDHTTRYFDFRHARFAWNDANLKFECVLPPKPSFELYREDRKTQEEEDLVGLDPDEEQCGVTWYGKNVIDVHIPHVFIIFARGISHPFFWFQFFAAMIWIMEEFYIYATGLVLASCVLVAIQSNSTQSNLQSIRDMAVFTCTMDVATTVNGKTSFVKKESSELVPGDLIKVNGNLTFPCDAVLLSGECVVNESMLTGESVPVVKVPVPKTMRANDRIRSQQTLFSGTLCLQARPMQDEAVFARVWRTGYGTAKGRLVRSILFASSDTFSVYNAAIKFMLILVGVGIASGFAVFYSMYMYYGNGLSSSLVDLLDILTIAIPPSLPTALLVGLVYSLRRLSQKKMFCISPSRVNVAGQVDLICFDKTGTLTEEGMDLKLGQPASHGEFHEASMASAMSSNNQSPTLHKFTSILASCHALRRLPTNAAQLDARSRRAARDTESDYRSSFWTCSKARESKSAAVDDIDRPQSRRSSTTQLSSDKQLVGDPLECKLFLSTKWAFVEDMDDEENKQDDNGLHKPEFTVVSPDPQNPTTIDVIRSLDFLSQLQRMSVVVRDGDEYSVFSKGSPEAIRKMCRPDTVPNNMTEAVEEYASNGYRVLACCSKSINYQEIEGEKLVNIPREEIEAKGTFEFAGLIVMENVLKPESKPTMHQLLDANIQCAMITGDHALTAVYVARECGILYSLDENDMQDVFIAQTRKERLAREGKEEEHEDGKDTEDQDSQDATGPGITWMNIRTHQVLTLAEVKERGLDCRHSRRVFPGFKVVLTGPAFEAITKFIAFDRTGINGEEWLLSLLERLAVAARFRPQQKQRLMELYKLNHCTCFCGDGANDCGALKAADIGLSLSPEAEASIAAPFTSKQCNIAPLVNLLAEGRAALITSLVCFKFVVLYALMELSFTLQMFFLDTSETDYQYIYYGMIAMPIVLFMGGLGPHSTLHKRPPDASLMSWANLLSVWGLFIFSIIIEIVARLVAKSWDWPEVFANYSHDVASYENTTLFHTNNFMLLWVAIAYAKGSPYRANPFKDVPFVLSLCWGMFIISFAMFSNLSIVLETLELIQLPSTIDVLELCVIIVMALVIFLFFIWGIDAINEKWLDEADKAKKEEEARDSVSSIQIAFR